MHIRVPQDGRKWRSLCWWLFEVNKCRQASYCRVALFALRRVVLQVEHRAICAQ